MPLNYPELDVLKGGLDIILRCRLCERSITDLNDNDLAANIGLCGAAGGSGSLGLGAVTGTSSLLVNSELTKRILVVVAKSFGVTGLAAILITGYIANGILKKSEEEQKTYIRDAKFVAMQTEQAIQGRQIAIQRCAIGAHLQITAQHQAQIARQGAQIAQQETKMERLQRQQQEQQQLLSDQFTALLARIDNQA